MDEQAAAVATWQLGMAAMMAMGAFKLVLSFAGGFVQRVVPRAGLLGSIAGIALMLMGFLPLVEALRVPIVGLVVLGLLLYALVARGRVPFRVPGVLFALLVGLLLHYGLGIAGALGTGYHAPEPFQWRLALPLPTLGVRLMDSVVRATGSGEITRDQLDYMTFGRVMDTTRMRNELGFEPKWSTLEAFDDYVRGRGLTAIFDPRWVLSLEDRAVALAQRWGN